MRMLRGPTTVKGDEMKETGLMRQGEAATSIQAQPIGRDPFGMLDALDRLGKSAFLRGLVDTGYYTERNDSKEQTLHKLVMRVAVGAELGRTPMWAIANIIMVKGNRTITGAGVGDLVFTSGFMAYSIVESTDKRCEMQWTRSGRVVGVSTWTIDEAKRAGLTGQGQWKTYPQDMLRNRCLTRGARMFCPDVTGGPAYVPEELRSEVVEVRAQHARETQHRTQAAPVKADPIGDARRVLMDTISECRGTIDATRVQVAIKKKLGKPRDMTTAADYTEISGMIRGFASSGNLDAWCNKVIGDVQEAEIVPAAPAETAETPGNQEESIALKHVWAAYCHDHGHHHAGDERRIMSDQLRAMSGLAPDGDWALVGVEHIRSMIKKLQHEGGKFAADGLANEWRQAAIDRGLDVTPF